MSYRVLKGFGLGNGEFAVPGEIRELDGFLAGQLVQQGKVERLDPQAVQSRDPVAAEIEAPRRGRPRKVD
jgi:hypothetical protein